jgi:DNA-binding CsgD family transcriptional regulator
MANSLITAKAIQSDTLYRAGSTVVNVRPDGTGKDDYKPVKPFEPVLEAIICFDSQMNIVWKNDYARYLFGITNEQIKTGKCYEILCKKQSCCAGCPVLKTLEIDGEHIAKVMTSDGKEIFVRSYPMRDENGRVNGAIGVMRDVSNSKYRQDVTEAYMFGSKMSLLTDREREVMYLVVEGYQNKEIGIKLNISPKTVEIHRARVMDKLKVRSTAQLVRYLTKYEIFSNFLT